jgi:hypothetical protein
VANEKQPSAPPTPGDFKPLSDYERRTRQRILSQDLAGIPSEFMGYINGQLELSTPKLVVTELQGIRGEEWREVGASGQPAFGASGWVNTGGTIETAAFYKDATGVVRIKGQVKSGTVGALTPIFVLPEGYRPPLTQTFAIVSNSAFGSLNVTSAGEVAVIVGNNASVNLNISFRAA